MADTFGPCPECGADHGAADPHDAKSPQYRAAFHAAHGRWPTWTDAMAHCEPHVRDLWRRTIVEGFERRGLPAPADLAPPVTPKVDADDVHNWSAPYVQMRWRGKLSASQKDDMLRAEYRHHRGGEDAQALADEINAKWSEMFPEPAE